MKITWVGNPKYITDKYDFKICTEFTKKGMDDYYKSSDNSNKYTNTVSYNADGIEGSTSCDAWINKHATLVKGFKEYTSENRIHWTIQMYQNKIDTLNNAELVDKLPEKGLIFIPSSVKIYRGHMYPGGYFSKDDNDLVDDSEYVVNYDVANAQFTIKFNNPIKRGTIYFVEYDTTITTDSIKNEVNKVTLKGKDITDVTVQSNVINVDVQSGAWSDKLSLNIVKKNSSKDKNLSGAVFKITCNNTNKSENFTTDSSGSIQKLNYLISGYKYTITEIKAPNGYVLDKTPIVFIAGNSGESANYNNATIQYNEKNRIQIITITNDQILSQFSFIKISGTNDSDKGKPLEGVQFKLYKKLVDDPNGIHDKADEDLSDNNVWEIYDTQYSLNNGSVTFSNLSAGSYRLVEIKTVQGYELPAGSWKIEVFSENGQVSKPLAIGLAPAFQLSPTRCKEPSYYLCNYKNVMVPITGSRGIVFPIFIGFMVAIGSVVVIIKSKKDLNYKNK